MGSLTPPKDDATVRIATYNLQNLFLAGEGPLTPQKRLRPLVRMIDQVAADLMVVQEVGSQASLQAVNAQLARPYPHCHVVPGNSVRNIHLGVLSRQPVNLSSHRSVQLSDQNDQPLAFYANQEQASLQQPVNTGFFRDVLLIETQLLDQCPLALFGLHLKSRTNQPWQLHSAQTYRLAECQALQKIVMAYANANPQRGLGLLGDFNDLLSSDALQPLQKLPLIDVIGVQLRQSGRNPSTYWPRRRMRIDHILLDQRLSGAMVDGSAVIHASNMAQSASDHYPVSLQLKAPVAS
jgi:endonuclease/exonuclease/phosphatase family metal-dependent hydrolase